MKEEKLTPAELMIAATAGVMRQVENVAGGVKDKHGANSEENGWQMHVEGACAEMTVAKALGWYWPGKGRMKAGDIGYLQVKVTHHPNGRLIVHDDAKDDDIYILTIGSMGSYAIIGWIKAKDAKQKAFWDDPKTGRPAYFVPHSALKGVELLTWQ